jgi:PAS domain S-box-containing protein
MKAKFHPLWLFLVAAIYVVAGKLGLSQAVLHAIVSPFWPPTGFAIAILWWLGYRISPAIWLGAFVVDLIAGVSVATASAMALGNTLEALAVVFLLRRFIGLRNPFYRAQDVVRFVLITGCVGAPIGATIGNISLYMGGVVGSTDFGELWLMWLLGDAVGALVVAPLLLTWADNNPDDRWTKRQFGESVLLLAASLAVSSLVFGGLFLPKVAGYPLEHLMLPFFFWAAFRLGPRGAATTITVLSAIAVWGTRLGFGPFGAHSPNESMLLLQVFIATSAVTALVLAAIVTERRRTEQALRAKEGQLQLITDITPIMLTQCSRDLRFRFVNRAYADIFSLTSDELVGKQILEIIGTDALAAIQTSIERVLQGHAVEYETEIPYQRAGRRYMRGTYMPEFDERGNVVGWVASLTDITERKLTEEQIRKLNAELQRRIDEFQTLIDTAPAGIAVAMNPECSYIWGNPEFGHMLGTDQIQNFSMSGPAADELPFRILRNGNEIPIKDLPMQRACREGLEVLDEELEIVRRDGTIIHELCRAMPLRDEQGRVRGCIGVFLNITERKQVEKERDRLLAREQQARAEAEAASRVKDEFLAVVSHELRTPLNSILGWAHLLRSGRLDAATAARALETIERNAKTQTQLVDDLLDVSRITSDKLQFDLKPVELTSVINTAVDSLRHDLESKEIQLRMTMQASASRVLGDTTRLQQVIWNLLSNSAKFTPRGGCIDIRLNRLESTVQLTVSDTGEGIRPEFLPHVFDRFRQEDSSRTRKHGGLGLGLAIVRHLIEMQGGTVEAYSAGENLGASFTVTLPLIEKGNDSGNPQTRIAAVLPHNRPRLAGIRLLIVEDNLDSLEMLRMVVESQGAEVRTATQSAEAQEMFVQWTPDVLISDIGLPDEDGYALIHKLNLLPQQQEHRVPAIALTGYAGDQEGECALESGFQMYFTKPIEPGKLIEAIADLVRSREPA